MSKIINGTTMNNTIDIGLINTLTINRFTDNGAYLIAQDEQEVLLPNSYLTKDMQEGDEVEAFIYTDSEDRIVATTTYPKGIRGDFIVTQVLDVTSFGAFVDIGLPKDLLVPKAKQKTTFEVGDKKAIFITIDDKTNRLIGTEKINNYLLTDTTSLRKNQKVNILVIQKTDLGYKVIVENNYEGLIFNNEIFQTIEIGDRLEAFIKNKRPDGKLDIVLQQIGKKNVQNQASQSIVEKLKSNDGFLPFTSKSDPEIIKENFGLSKKNFKATLTQLVNENKIVVVENGIKLV
jgi:predicted RNA-binding protein (virulence factor B family)